MVGEKFYCAQRLAHLRGGREGSNYLPAIACPWITRRKDTIICSKSCGALCRSHDELLVCAAEYDCEMQAYVSAIRRLGSSVRWQHFDSDAQMGRHGYDLVILRIRAERLALK